jgi:hypothetical protein
MKWLGIEMRLPRRQLATSRLSHIMADIVDLLVSNHVNDETEFNQSLTCRHFHTTSTCLLLVMTNPYSPLFVLSV